MLPDPTAHEEQASRSSSSLPPMEKTSPLSPHALRARELDPLAVFLVGFLQTLPSLLQDLIYPPSRDHVPRPRPDHVPPRPVLPKRASMTHHVPTSPPLRGRGGQEDAVAPRPTTPSQGA